MRSKSIIVKALSLILGICLICTGCKKEEEKETVIDSVSVSESGFTATSNGGVGKVIVESSGKWSAETYASWVSLSPNNGTSGDELAITVYKNTTSEIRTCVINVKCGTAKATITIEQSEFQDFVEVSEPSITIPYEGGTKSVKVSSSATWQAQSTVNWITISPNSGTNDMNLNITVGQNTATESRNGSVNVTCGNTFATINVTQNGFVSFVEPSETSFTISSAGGTKNVTISSSGTWQAQSSVNWVTLSSNSGENGATMIIAIAENTMSESRSAFINLTCGTSNAVITITQDGFAESVEVSQDYFAVSCNGDTKNVVVTSTGLWQAESSVNWITLSPNTGTSGTTINITVAKNETTESRSGFVTVNCGTSNATINIAQEANAVVAETIKWCGIVDVSTGVGRKTEGYSYMGAGWTADQLSDYQGMTIDRVTFYPSADAQSFTLQIWKDGSPVYQQPVTDFTIEVENTITLNNAITVDVSENLVIAFMVYEYGNENGYYPRGVDYGPAIDGYGDLSYDGQEWYSVHEYNSIVNCNFYIVTEISGMGKSTTLSHINAPQPSKLVSHDRIRSGDEMSKKKR